MKKAALTILLVLLADQWLKIWIKTHMTLGQEITVAGNWFIIHFTENEGMAFGMTFGGSTGKLMLSLLRIVAVVGISYYLYRIIRNREKTGLIICISLILAGALGNILDSVFYGLLFSASSFHEVARFLPGDGHYASLLHGKVVDMFYFPVFQGRYPDWIPVLGSKEFIFFRPVFNISDAAITSGVAMLLVFQRDFFKKPKPDQDPDKVDDPAPAPLD